jgi:hypothetical protein
MAEKKVFMESDNRVLFVCPRCDSAQRRDVSAYRRHQRPVRLSFTCGKCGSTATVVLERRSHYRMSVGKPGAYGPVSGLPEGRITVLDLSRTGIRVELDRETEYGPGDRMLLEFTLPDGSVVQREVVVIHSDRRTVRAEFRRPLDLPPRVVG